MKTIPVELVPSLNKFLTAVNTGIEKYWKRMNFTFADPSQVRVHSIGKKYARLGVYENRSGNTEFRCKSVYCFLDLTTGDLYKGSWKAPVDNGKRANLNDADLLRKFDVHGPCYIGCYANSIEKELSS